MQRLLLIAAFAQQLQTVHTITQELYTTNAVCKQKFCANPVFPGLMTMIDMEQKAWTKWSVSEVSSVMDFCGGVVDYDIALPLDATSNPDTTVAKDTAIEADRNASTLYFYHLSGIGMEAWEHQQPMEPNSHPLQGCAKEVARMACFTYFPKGTSLLEQGQSQQYVRPCSSTCQSYVQACNVECCDESVQCVFQKEMPNTQPPPVTDASNTSGIIMTGYIEAAAPSFACTGTASVSAKSGFWR